MDNEIAILIFTQELSKDAALKTLTPNKNLGLNKNLFQKLNQRVNHIAYSTHLPVFKSIDFEYSKGSYGEQLTFSIEKVFEKGFKKVICLGNDCPTFSKVQILDAEIELQKSDSVVGPDQHGGVYLLGVSQSNFDAETFKNLAWKTNNMLESYLEKFENLSIFTLDTIEDIQTFQQLKAYNNSNFFVKYLLQIIQNTFSQKVYFITYSIHNQINRYFSLRAPPVY